MMDKRIPDDKVSVVFGTTLSCSGSTRTADLKILKMPSKFGNSRKQCSRKQESREAEIERIIIYYSNLSFLHHS